jgi:hypothetical protein
MPDAELDDLRWLMSDAAAGWLQLAARSADEPLASAEHLRRELSAARTALVLEQAQLRRRARRKFSAADRMFFTARGLEQATDQRIAAYKRQRFAGRGSVADLCCGIGGDLAALSAVGPVVGVERDLATALLAAANLAAVAQSGASSRQFRGESCVVVGDAAACDVTEYAAWHIDPDRRAEGKRTTRVSNHEPNAAAIDALRRQNAHAAVKLAPAAEVPDCWATEAELEWIGHDRQCQQLVAWFGGLAACGGRRRTTVLGDEAAHSFVGARGTLLPTAAQIGRFVYEPHAAVLAADVWGDLASKHGLSAVAPRIAYLTADGRVDDPLLARFEVLEVLPLRTRRLKEALRRLRGGRLEVKKRGVDIDPDALRRELAADGDERITVLVTRRGSRTIAILARRGDA